MILFSALAHSFFISYPHHDYWDSIMHIIIIGCEYSGKSSLAINLMKWGKKHDINYHLDDHFTIPDSSLPTEDREVMLTLSPLFKRTLSAFSSNR